MGETLHSQTTFGPMSTMSLDEAGRAKTYHEYETFKQKVLAEGRPVRRRLVFQYTNSRAVKTVRAVDTVAIFESQRGRYLVGHCYLRDELRTFRMAEAWEVFDVESGRTFESLGKWAAGEPAALALVMLDAAAVLKLVGSEPEPPDDAAASAQALAKAMEETGRWAVQMSGTSSAPGDMYLSARRLKASGEPNKLPSLSLMYRPARTLQSHGPDGSIVATDSTAYRRPWHLHTKTGSLHFPSLAEARLHPTMRKLVHGP